MNQPNILNIVIKSILSQSPQYSKDLRKILLAITAALAAIKFLASYHLIPGITEEQLNLISKFSEMVGIFATGLFGATWMQTTDPNLLSPDIVNAVTSTTQQPPKETDEEQH